MDTLGSSLVLFFPSEKDTFQGFIQAPRPAGAEVLYWSSNDAQKVSFDKHDSSNTHFATYRSS